MQEDVFTKCQGENGHHTQREKERAGNSPSSEQNNEKKIHQSKTQNPPPERGREGERGKRVVRWVGDGKTIERWY